MRCLNSFRPPRSLLLSSKKTAFSRDCYYCTPHSSSSRSWSCIIWKELRNHGRPHWKRRSGWPNYYFCPSIERFWVLLLTLWCRAWPSIRHDLHREYGVSFQLHHHYRESCSQTIKSMYLRPVQGQRSSKIRQSALSGPTSSMVGAPGMDKKDHKTARFQYTSLSRILSELLYEQKSFGTPDVALLETYGSDGSPYYCIWIMLQSVTRWFRNLVLLSNHW